MESTLDQITTACSVQSRSTRPFNEAYVCMKGEDYFRKLDKFNAPYLEEKLLGEHVFDSRESYQEAFDEFKRFIALGVMHGLNIGMQSKQVDAVWHQFILFTPQYHEFCREFVGKYFHHVPQTSVTPLPPNIAKNFTEVYSQTYGEMPAIWNTPYVLSSDCTPIEGDKEGSSQDFDGDGGGDDD